MNMPAFHRCPREAEVIGRLLAGYGEIEFQLAQCLGIVLGDAAKGYRAYFRLRSESSRLDVVDALMRDDFTAASLQGQYAQATGAARHALKIRNMYAHCHWADDKTGALFFTNLQEAADAATGFSFEMHWADPDLLADQEAFFEYTSECLYVLGNEYKIKNGKLKNQPFQMPKARFLPITKRPVSARDFIGEVGISD